MSHTVYHQTGSAVIRAWIGNMNIEEEAYDQLVKVSRLPFIHKHIAVMPDVHAGKGTTIGSVIATKGAVIPSAVGVDIGCGMMAQRTSLKQEDLPDSLSSLRTQIESTIPLDSPKGREGRAANSKAIALSIDNLELLLSEYVSSLSNTDINALVSKAHNQIGTLGGGNHFCELNLDEEGYVWIVLHSGSRGIGNFIGNHFISLAKEEMARYFIDLPDKDLAYLPSNTVNFERYMRSVYWAQEYAVHNRKVMLEDIQNILRSKFEGISFNEGVISCHHNYVALENHFGDNVLVTRKGAVRAREGDLGIIPGSMGTKTYIVRGKGNKESFCSCSHGAGRRMSRTKAKAEITLEEHISATKGVECRKDVGILDESPAAYKSLSEVMAAQEDLVDIVYELTPILCVKG